MKEFRIELTYVTKENETRVLISDVVANDAMEAKSIALHNFKPSLGKVKYIHYENKENLQTN